MVRSTATARERELYRYYQPPDDEAIVPEIAPRVVPVPRSSVDPALTAFAQLGALRLNTKRSIISLVGPHTEYILAEASRTISLLDDTRHNIDDGLWHGVGAMNSKGCLGGVLIDLLIDRSGEVENYVVVEDLALDERFCDLPIVVDAPHARFLACFPLKTPAGYTIGTYTLVDDKPREGISKEDVDFLRDISTTVVNHITADRVKARHHRSERMIKALGLYLEGGESIRDWWVTQGQDNQSMQQTQIREGLRRGVTFAAQADVEFGIQDTQDKSSLSETLLQKSESIKTSTKRAAPGDGRPQVQSVNSGSLTRTSLSTNDSFFNPGRPIGESSDNTSVENLTQPMSQNTSDLQPISPFRGKRSQETFLLEEVRRSFSRASNLLREAMDVEGVVFFDASGRSFESSSRNPGMGPTAPGAHVVNGKDVTTTTSSDTDERLEVAQDAIPVDQDGAEDYASVLGFSTRSRSSLHEHMADNLRFSESVLKRMAKRCPHGKVHNFLDDGSISASDAEVVTSDGAIIDLATGASSKENSKRIKKKHSRHNEGKAIQRVFPGARSVAFFPMWNTSRERWYANCIVWSNKVTRALDSEEDLTYLAAFTNSIMAEVGRISATITSQLKEDFVSSVSHELRSPLHGVLASVEFLYEDGNLSHVQADNVSTIQACGTMLLETIDHILDFSAINRKFKARKSKSTSANRRSRPKPLSRGRAGGLPPPEEHADLRTATEEVVHSIFAARFLTRSENGEISSIQQIDPSADKPAPIVIVDMQYRDNWLFSIEGGAWRRIVMNLFGNALKYTESGFVHLELSSSNKLQSGSTLILRIRDSGRGISQEFLDTHLYTAFKQENSLASGTGLGLNLVRQMALDLGGQIDISSEIHSGTSAVFSVPLQSPLGELSEKDDILALRSRTAGIQACFIGKGFGIMPDVHEEATGILTPGAEALILLKDSLHSMMTDWFAMDVSTVADFIDKPTSVIVTMSFTDVDEAIGKWDAGEHEQTGVKAVVVIRYPHTGHSHYTTASGLQVVSVALPVTIQKLAQTFSQIEKLKPKTEAGISAITEAIRPTELQHNQPANSADEAINKFNERTSSASSGRLLNQRAGSARRERPLSIRRHSSKKNLSFQPADDEKDAGEPFNILLVEDNPINLKLLVTCIKKLSHTYTTARHGLEAVSAFQAGQPHNGTEASQSSILASAINHARPSYDVIFMDLHMPFMDGLAATREVRAYERARDKQLGITVPPATIIALTAATSDASRQEAYNSGIDLFLAKPVAMKVLKHVLDELRSVGREGLRRNWDK